MALYYFSKATSCAISALKEKREFDGDKSVHGSPSASCGGGTLSSTSALISHSLGILTFLPPPTLSTMEDMPVKNHCIFLRFQEGGGISILIADAHCCPAETNPTL